jgi:hypothetical protein
LREFEVRTISKVVPYVSKCHPAKFGEFWTSKRSHFQISKFGHLKIFDYLRGSRGPVCQRPTTAHGRVSSQRMRTQVVTPRWLGHHTPPRTQHCQPLYATCPSRPPRAAHVRRHCPPLSPALVLKQSESPFLLPVTISQSRWALLLAPLCCATPPPRAAVGECRASSTGAAVPRSPPRPQVKPRAKEFLWRATLSHLPLL